MKVLAAAIAFLVVPAAADAASLRLYSRDLAVSGGAAKVAPFDLVGIHWQGAGAVQFRTRGRDGRWARWRTADAESEDLPDRRTAEAQRLHGWRLGNPYWAPGSVAIQYRAVGAVRRLRAFFVRSPVRSVRERQRQLFVASSPQIVPRRAWGANERIRRSAPHYAPELKFAVVHHTAGSNSYSRAQSAAIVRSIQAYHVLGNGWDDIGYNFLVDKYGQVFEGRFGGIERPVIGAHALGFNRGSAGVALIGNYNSSTMTAAARSALVRLLAWRLDIAHIDPLSVATAVSTGNPRFRAGTRVPTRVISGHRDVYPTSCPGTYVYGQLSNIRTAVAQTGLPKIYAPLVRGSVGGKVRFTARLSAPLQWTVTVTDSLNKTVASGLGLGSTVDWTWDARRAARGRYGYTIAAGPYARPVIGSLGGPTAQLTVSDLRVDPEIVTPNGDRRGDNARVTYRLGAAATVTAMLVNDRGEARAILFSGLRRAGQQSFVWKQIREPDGRYTLFLTARTAAGTEVTTGAQFTIDRTVAGFRATPAAISPNADGRSDSTTLSFRLAVPADVVIQIRRNTSQVGTAFVGRLGAGETQIVWDGGGLRDGVYRAAIVAADTVTTVTQEAVVKIDRLRPQLRLLSATRMLFSISEPATVTADLGGRRVVKNVRRGRFRLPRARSFRVFAVDAAANQSRAIQRP
jgi:N-acetylmuramoyl-L-alanine amidase